MKNVINIIIIGLILSGFLACEKMSEGNILQDTKGDLTNVRSECEIHTFTTDEFKLLGEMHNAYLDTLYSQCKNVNDIALLDSLRSVGYTLDLDFSVFNLTKYEVIDSAIAQAQQLMLADFEIANLPLSYFGGSQDIKIYTETVALVIDSARNYAGIENGLQNLRIQAYNDISLSCLERQHILGIISVGIYSSRMWCPINLGGLGYGLLGNDNGVTIRDWNWKDVVTGDIAGSAGFFLNGGILWGAGLLVPGTNVAILTGWALSAAYGSVLGGLL